MPSSRNSSLAQPIKPIRLPQIFKVATRFSWMLAQITWKFCKKKEMKARSKYACSSIRLSTYNYIERKLIWKLCNMIIISQKPHLTIHIFKLRKKLHPTLFSNESNSTRSPRETSNSVKCGKRPTAAPGNLEWASCLITSQLWRSLPNIYRAHKSEESHSHHYANIKFFET